MNVEDLAQLVTAYRMAEREYHSLDREDTFTSMIRLQQELDRRVAEVLEEEANWQCQLADRQLAIIGTAPRPNLTFHLDSEQIGELSWENGVFRFKGSPDDSAKLFFDNLKPMIEEYWKHLQRQKAGSHE